MGLEVKCGLCQDWAPRETEVSTSRPNCQRGGHAAFLTARIASAIPLRCMWNKPLRHGSPSPAGASATSTEHCACPTPVRIQGAVDRGAWEADTGHTDRHALRLWRCPGAWNLPLEACGRHYGPIHSPRMHQLKRCLRDSNPWQQKTKTQVG